MAANKKGEASPSKSVGVKYPGKNLLDLLKANTSNSLRIMDGTTIEKAEKKSRRKMPLHDSDPAAAPVPLEHKKEKRKKRLRLEEADGALVQIGSVGSPVPSTSAVLNEDGEQRKKKKKSKKNRAGPEILDGGTTALPAEGGVATGTTEPRKKKTKKEKSTCRDEWEIVVKDSVVKGMAAEGQVDEGGEKKKKKKKKKNGHGLRDEEVPTTSERECLKAKKKEKRARLGPQQGPPDAVEGIRGEPKQKKQKKGESLESELVPSQVGRQAELPSKATESAHADRKKWKHEKAKQPLAGGAQTQNVWAQVGDLELARSGPPIKKRLYHEAAEVSAWPQAELEAWRAERMMVVEGSSLKPVTRFHQAGFSKEMLESTRTFSTPSPIQAQSWPIVMSGHDLVGIAATGSGKTLAFGLPALRHILAQREAGSYSRRPGCLVVAPTRELAIQIGTVLEEAGQPCGISALTAYGGVPKKEQARALKRGVDIVVATPGRLQDLVQEGSCRLDGVTYLVLDEADRMLDLGFEPDIRAIASRTRADRQTLMFSATWPPAIRKLAAEFLANPVRVTVGSADISASHSVTQVVEVMDPRDRDARLLQLLRKWEAGKERVLVFVLYKVEAPRVEGLLRGRGFKVAAIHGNIGQDKRTEAVENFKSGGVPILVATDVAARGLDIQDVAAVINYSFPLTIEDYVHRIGRTGRAGKTGVAYTFFCGQNDKLRAGELMNVLREAGQPIPPELLRFGSTVKKKENKLYGAHFKDVDPAQKSSKITFDSDDE